MKTVKDYKQLGLVFIQGDYINTHEGKKQDPLNLHGVGYCNDSTFNDEKFAIEFAWRNNEGVKPEYMGLIEAGCESGDILEGISSDFMYWWDDGTIIKWRPVVLQSDDAKKEMQEKFLSALYSGIPASKNVWNAIREQFCLPVGIDSPELREVFKSFNDYMESNPKFTIKEEAPSRTMTVNIEGRDYLIPSHTPTVSPKEDKQMKPVYTAEMHAKGEIPPVGAECEALCMDAMNKHVWTKAKILMHYDGNECAVHCIDAGVLRWADEFRPIPKTIKVNGFDVPAPMSKAPERGAKFYNPSICYYDYFDVGEWIGDGNNNMWLSRGLVHSNKSAAIAHAKAMLGIDPNA